MINASKSPMKSHAFNPYRLPKPKKSFDLEQTLRPEMGKSSFETIAKARKEDFFRSTQLKRSGLRDAVQLGEWLKNATETEALPLSCASTLYMRIVRRRLIGDLSRHIAEQGFSDDVTTFTLIHPKWYWSTNNLFKCQPKRIKAALRRYLDRAGIAKSDGMLFAGLHGEFIGNGYQVHFHGIAVGQKAVALDNLRGNFGFVTTKKIKRPIHISRLQNPPRQLSYLIQSFWPTKKEFINSKGKKRRERQKSRVPSPQHEEILVWLSKQNLNDLILMNGMRLGKNGLQ